MKCEPEKLGRVPQRRQIGPVDHTAEVEHRSTLPQPARDVRASDGPDDRVHVGRGIEDRMTRETPSAILRESARVCRVFGRRIGGVIIIAALWVSRPVRRSPSPLWAIAGLLAVLKYFGHL
jgi:hypothetical protein